jgi:hypothetical protein
MVIFLFYYHIQIKSSSVQITIIRFYSRMLSLWKLNCFLCTYPSPFYRFAIEMLWRCVNCQSIFSQWPNLSRKNIVFTIKLYPTLPLTQYPQWKLFSFEHQCIYLHRNCETRMNRNRVVMKYKKPSLTSKFISKSS